jgi:hypothetical protein
MIFPTYFSTCRDIGNGRGTKIFADQLTLTTKMGQIMPVTVTLMPAPPDSKCYLHLWVFNNKANYRTRIRSLVGGHPYKTSSFFSGIKSYHLVSSLAKQAKLEKVELHLRVNCII